MKNKQAINTSTTNIIPGNIIIVTATVIVYVNVIIITFYALKCKELGG